ncbi:DDB1- and CUL4-associated factor-like 1 [Spatholobus suberectus]|nr:DDB1- and CUL4-associated factor-like 1 [Spatholobus suberectus]
MSNLGQVSPSSLVINAHQPNNPERITLDSLAVQCLKHQRRQCPTPITTLPSLSLLHPHVCPEPKRSLDAPSNVTSRLGTREFKFMYGGVHGNRRDRQFVYSRFRLSCTCADVYSLTCTTFLGDSSFIAVGSKSGDIQLSDFTSSSEPYECHFYPMTLIQSFISGDSQLLLSSST